MYFYSMLNYIEWSFYTVVYLIYNTLSNISDVINIYIYTSLVYTILYYITLHYNTLESCSHMTVE